MREILFRGFHECENGTQKAYYGGEWHKGIWVEGYFCRAFRWTGDKYPVPAIQEADSFYFREVAPETVCQYTGLDDKHEKKIFENDIVKYSGKNHKVVFEQRVSSAYFGIVMSSSETWTLCNEVPTGIMEIIGNKFENPELLEVEE